jgi:hypothetical protein
MVKQQKARDPAEVKAISEEKGSIEKQEKEAIQKVEMHPIKERSEETVSKR